ncbi:MAG: hypothetical protein JWN40_816 [Phycisphaerales bacterium]|nr:hypothetical protein [Phycisphaerales bacterium]
MRWGFLILLGILAIGCASKPAQPTATVAPARIYDDAVAAALVYDPPVVANSPRLDVSREGRAATAYAGFDEVITTFYYLRVDDRQQSFGSGGHHDRFERQAITERVGVSYR